MKLLNEISRVDRFDASWSQIERKEGQTLKQLKAIATVRSVGASTRIEGSKMTDEEVTILIDRLQVSKLEERDEQEVVGYFEALDTVAESYKDIDITEGNIRHLHKILMGHSTKDEWHRGDYKQMSNAVEASHADGGRYVVFKTTEPGIPTEDAMRNLIAWYHSDHVTLPIVKAALFVYDFLSIHPFQDGNGRLSRLLGTLLLLRNGYSWVQYVSFEHEIESRKAEYYKVLMETQKQRPGEEVDKWVVFFLNCLINIQAQLMEKLTTKAHTDTHLAPREKSILAYIENHPGSKSGDIAEKLNIPLPTVKKMLSVLVKSKAVLKYGIGAGTNYVAEAKSPLKSNLMFQLTDIDRRKEFLLMSPDAFICIKKIILTPLFTWTKPIEWSTVLTNQGLRLEILYTNNKGGTIKTHNWIAGYNSSHYFEPAFTLYQPIILRSEYLQSSDYPVKLEINLAGATGVDIFYFDVMFVYDEQE